MRPFRDILFAERYSQGNADERKERNNDGEFMGRQI